MPVPESSGSLAANSRYVTSTSSVRISLRLGILDRWQDPYLTLSAHTKLIAQAFVDFLDQGYVYTGD